MAMDEFPGASRVGWWAGAEPPDPMAALTGWLLRREVAARCPWFSTLLVQAAPASWAAPGFTGEPVALNTGRPVAGAVTPPFDVFVISGGPGPGGPELARSLEEAGTACVAVAAGAGWGVEEHLTVGPPFAVPEPAVLAARHLSSGQLAARAAYLRVVEGMPPRHVLVEDGLFEVQDEGLLLSLARLARGAGDGRPAEVVRLAPGPLSPEDPEVEDALRSRRAEVEEGRHQPEDWEGYPGKEPWPLRVTSPVDLAAAVASAGAVVAASGALMALAWSLGVPHVALAPEESGASDFAAWTGDTSAQVEEPAQVVATVDNIFARRGRPPGLDRLEATLDQALDQAGSDLEKAAAVAGASRRSVDGKASATERLHELQAANDALRMRMAAERMRFGERAALLERTAHTTVESAIKAVHGQDVMLRRRLEETEKELRRLQEETAGQQAELREIRETFTWKAVSPLRDWYSRVGRGGR